MFLSRVAGTDIHNKGVVKESKGAHRCLEEFPRRGGRFFLHGCTVSLKCKTTGCGCQSEAGAIAEEPFSGSGAE
ncbi:hypothetical protein [Endozoicomonas sp. SESOKO3]|uniref:hypothetical protein n=1 Tax=Endozoicomonas sp. SESOKO3 TaxID=2828744 RepID=UPI0021495698|nr:hypothetical protein [Endozoicomonas sp. SESOKO3]